MQDGTLSTSEEKTATRSDLCARSLGGKVNSWDFGEETAIDFLEGVEIELAPTDFEYFHMTSCRPQTNQAQPSFDRVTLHSAFPADKHEFNTVTQIDDYQLTFCRGNEFNYSHW